MKFDRNEKYTTIAFYVLVVMLVTLLFVFIGLNFEEIAALLGKFIDIIRPIIYGFVFAFLLHPMTLMFDRIVFKRIKKDKPDSKLRHMLSVTSAFLLTIGFVLMFGFIFVPSALQNYSDFISRISDYFGVLQGRLAELSESSVLLSGLFDDLTDTMNELLVNLYKFINTATPIALSFIGRVVTETKNIFLGLIIAFYFLIDKERLTSMVRRLFKALLPEKVYAYLLRVGRLSYVTFSEFVVGETLDSILMGMILFTLMNLLGMPYASLISLFVGLCFFIPSIGGYIGAIPSTLIILVASPSKALWFIIIIIGLQIFDGLLIEPKILSEQNSMSALWVLGAIVIMSGILGFWGLIVGVPLFMVIRTLIKEALEKRLASRGLPTDTDAYSNKQ